MFRQIAASFCISHHTLFLYYSLGCFLVYLTTLKHGRFITDSKLSFQRYSSLEGTLCCQFVAFLVIPFVSSVKSDCGVLQNWIFTFEFVGTVSPHRC
ncbi:hypothetical protein VNO80_29277 [Phaseolus coccineus]|uniref:Uncharacterized protein n=1 Tax=Phaseolus coccineus TaxID=3886 RepID=A0AAN9QER7_PHACN